MQEINDDASLREIVMGDIDIVISTGYNKPLTMLTLADKVDIIRTVSLHYTILNCTAELEQLKKGFSSLGILNIFHHNPSIVAFSSPDDQCLTAGKPHTVVLVFVLVLF